MPEAPLFGPAGEEAHTTPPTEPPVPPRPRSVCPALSSGRPVAGRPPAAGSPRAARPSPLPAAKPRRAPATDAGRRARRAGARRTDKCRPPSAGASRRARRRPPRQVAAGQPWGRQDEAPPSPAAPEDTGTGPAASARDPRGGGGPARRPPLGGGCPALPLPRSLPPHRRYRYRAREAEGRGGRNPPGSAPAAQRPRGGRGSRGRPVAAGLRRRKGAVGGLPAPSSRGRYLPSRPVPPAGAAPCARPVPHSPPGRPRGRPAQGAGRRGREAGGWGTAPRPRDQLAGQPC